MPTTEATKAHAAPDPAPVAHEAPNGRDAAADDLHASYEADHRHPLNRALHFVGVPIIATGVVTLFFRPVAGVSLIGLGYGFNFLGHAIEGTMPSLFRDPRHVAMGAKHFGTRIFSALRGRAGR